MRNAALIGALVLAGLLGLFWLGGGMESMVRWAEDGQREFQNALAVALRNLRAGETGALLALLGITFAYGFFHAVGPGHGKFLIGGYGAASQVRLVPLAGIALAASLGQATMAVVLIYGGIFVLGWTTDALIGLGEGAMTVLSFAAIGLIGLWLVWRGMRGLMRLAQARAMPTLAPEAMPVPVSAGHAPEQALGHQHSHRQAQLHRAHGDATCEDCGHRHGPSAADIAGLKGWRDAALLIGAIAIRPCTGALFLLILTWRMGIDAAGIAGAYAMGLGTATVTIAVAALSVSAREGAFVTLGRLAGLRVLVPVLELTIGAVVALVAVQLLIQAA